MQVSQSTHRQSFIAILADEIRDRASANSVPFHRSAVDVLLEWLGYNSSEVHVTEGSDRGIDAWVSADSGLEIFQFKTHQPTPEGIINLSPFNGQGVHDLERAQTFLLQERPDNVRQQELQQLLHLWHSQIYRHKLDEVANPIGVILHLVILGEGLTPQAQAEFEAFRAQSAAINDVNDAPVQFHVVLHTIDQIIDGKWREQNRDWKDLKGKKHERIQLTPRNEAFISDHANAIFYCATIDLVRAYEALGYQLFEPNVRANIKNSPVNQAIRDSVMHQRTRREFRFLNNGVTLVCDSFSVPNKNRPQFTVLHPGVVNGLQTVVALHQAYQSLTDQDKEDFEQNCWVLVRLLTSKAVEDITQVVRSTNNQNPMKARNLMSNNKEQLLYARVFAEQLGWFYEAKEGSWDAFDKDPQRWRPRLHKRPKDFRSGRKVRRIDNANLAQEWLSFIGFAYEAVNDKRELFGNQRFYDLVFNRITINHGFDYDFSRDRANRDAEERSPDPSIMLVAFLVHRFAEEIPPSASQNRQEAQLRLNSREGIDFSAMTRAEVDARLSLDDRFVLNQALKGMSFLFTEFVGFVFFRAFGKEMHQYGQRILRNYSLALLSTEYDIETVRERINKESCEPDDVLAVLWFVFVETIEDMLSSSWGASYRAANIKVRFIYSKETRERLHRETQNTDDFMKKRTIKKPWAIGVQEGQGLFDFIRSCILS
jgi:hypothetical protein